MVLNAIPSCNLANSLFNFAAAFFACPESVSGEERSITTDLFATDIGVEANFLSFVTTASYSEICYGLEDGISNLRFLIVLDGDCRFPVFDLSETHDLCFLVDVGASPLFLFFCWSA